MKSLANLRSCHDMGVCVMSSTCARRFACAMHASEQARTELAMGELPQPTRYLGPCQEADEAADQPIATAEGMEALCVGTLCVIAFLLALAGGLWLLWAHDATLRGAAQSAWAVLQQIGWAYLHANW